MRRMQEACMDGVKLSQPNRPTKMRHLCNCAGAIVISDRRIAP